jgi:hypothetical protein
MAWFCNHYKCASCGREWTDEWSCMCDDDCPHCGARHMSPRDSDDLTEIIVLDSRGFAVFRSSDAAEHTPSYHEVGTFPTLESAEAYLRGSSGRSDSA